MKRRTVLSLGAVGVTGTISGCTSVLDGDDSVQPRIHPTDGDSPRAVVTELERITDETQSVVTVFGDMFEKLDGIVRSGEKYEDVSQFSEDVQSLRESLQKVRSMETTEQQDVFIDRLAKIQEVVEKCIAAYETASGVVSPYNRFIEEAESLTVKSTVSEDIESLSSSVYDYAIDARTKLFTVPNDSFNDTDLIHIEFIVEMVARAQQLGFYHLLLSDGVNVIRDIVPVVSALQKAITDKDVTKVQGELEELVELGGGLVESVTTLDVEGEVTGIYEHDLSVFECKGNQLESTSQKLLQATEEFEEGGRGQARPYVMQANKAVSRCDGELFINPLEDTVDFLL